ncbi:MAG: hypothetical protein IKJ30_04245 [Bacilli bacterium]|nr:hypothetical protein [Bacilli bacterium]
MYEREYLVSHDFQGAAVALGVGAAFTGVGLFAPGGILEAGLFSPMIIFFALGVLVLVASLVAFLGAIKTKAFKQGDANSHMNKIVVQAAPDGGATLIIGFAFGGMGSLFAIIGLIVPEGVLQYGMASEMLLFVIMGGSFAFIGISQLLTGIPHMKASMIYKKLYTDVTAFTTSATYFEEPVVTDQSVEINGVSIAKHTKPLLYKYQDETGVARIAQTPGEFTDKEHAWFKNRGSFKIRCKGKYSVLMDLPDIEEENIMSDY